AHLRGYVRRGLLERAGAPAPGGNGLVRARVAAGRVRAGRRRGLSGAEPVQPARGPDDPRRPGAPGGRAALTAARDVRGTPLHVLQVTRGAIWGGGERHVLA